MDARCTTQPIVLSVGPSARAAAREVCRKRQWPEVYVASLAEAGRVLSRNSAETALVVADLGAEPPHTLTDLAALVARDLPELSLGLLYGRSESELAESAQRLPASPFSPDEHARQIAFASPDTVQYIRGARVQRAGELASAPYKAADLITELIDLLYVVGHSNGHDAGVDGVILCRRFSNPTVSPEHRAYPCYHGSECRFAASEYAIRAADAIRARAVVSLTCWGISTVDFPFAVELSVGEGMLRHGGVQSLLTTVRPISMTAEDFLAFYYFLNSGLPAGRAANKVNQLRIERGETAEFLCFGDPQTRFAPTVLQVQATPRGDGAFVCEMEPSPAERDIAVPMAESCASRRSVLVIENEDPVSAALLARGVLYATVAATSDSAALRFRLASPEEFSNTVSFIQAVRDDLEYIDRFLRGIERNVGHPYPDWFIRLKGAVLALEDLLDTWPVQACEPGAVVRQADVRKRHALLTAYLDALAETFVILCAEHGHIGDKYVMTAASNYQRRLGWAEGAVACQYCGFSIREELFCLQWRKSERRMGICDVCGPIYEGNPSVTRWLLGDGVQSINTKILVSIDVQNPYGFSVPAAAVLAIGGYERLASAVQCSSRATIGAAGRERLSAEVAFPSRMRPGVQYLQATVIVGASVVHLKRPVRFVE